MTDKKESPWAIFLFGFVLLIMAVLMFFGSRDGQGSTQYLLGGLLSAVTFGALGAGFLVYGLIRLEKNTVQSNDEVIEENSFERV